ncbi:MAG: HAD family phosphatase [Actinobacteria bacterium]|nr:HAD family phosphatase [Actinomycetota bacterium]
MSTTTKTAAFFDLDGTLIPGSANIPLAKAAFRAGFVTPGELARDLRNGISFLLSGATDERSAQVRDRILRAVAGHPAEDVEALSDHFLAGLVASLRPQLEPALARHKANGEDRIVLSASPTEIVSRFAHEAGLSHGAGTTAARDDNGVYTGELAGPFCYGDGKVEVMRQLAQEHGYNLEDSYAYSDSASDLPMLEAVGHPVVVHPEPELRAIAEQRGWPVIETSTVPRVSLRSLRGWATLVSAGVKSVNRFGLRTAT